MNRTWALRLTCAAALLLPLGMTPAVGVPTGGDAPAVARSRWLASVSLDSPTDGWAVGSSGSSDLRPGNIVEHWDGTGWARVKSPKVTTYGFLSATAAVSPTDAWAVGSTNGEALVEHWDGQRWSVADAVPQANCYLLSVAASGADDVWAVGFSTASFNEFLEHWDGSTWTHVTGAAPSGAGLNDIEATSPTNVWASGFWGSVGAYSPLMEHWNGTSWSWSRPASGVFPTGASVNGITSLSAKNAWVAGSFTDSNSVKHPLIGHWNGKKWKITPSPALDDASLSDIRAISADDVWAAGQLGTKTLIEHWDGSSWTQVDSPSAGNQAILLGLDATGPDAVFAVGGYVSAGGRPALIERWDGSSWTRVAAAPRR